MWGHSPNVDILQVMNSLLEKKCDNRSIIKNVFCLGACDVRHLLTSLCHARRYKEHLNYYFWEDSMIGMARIILFIAIAVDFDTIIEERTQLLLEIYGNTLLRNKTTKYLQTIAASLVRCVLINTNSHTPYTKVNLKQTHK